MEKMDEGYSSKSSSPKREESLFDIAEIIAEEEMIFSEKYLVEKLIQNSCNGVIYKGRKKLKNLRNLRIFEIFGPNFLFHNITG